MEVKKRKVEFAPYKHINNKHVVIMWDYKPIKHNNAKGVEIETPLATWQEHVFNYVPTMEDIQNVILNYYNEKTFEKITSGMMWNGMNIWLSTENQFNYKVIYDLAQQTNGANLPITLKFGTCNNPVYYQFIDIDTLTDFYTKTVEHVQSTLREGWQIKDSIDWKEFQ